MDTAVGLAKRLAREPGEKPEIFRERRDRLAKELLRRAAAPCLIVASHPEQIRNGNVGFGYRQDSNFYYLTGFEEPESVFVFRPGQTPESVLFVRAKDATRETWDGFRFGIDLTKKLYGVDEVYLIDDFSIKVIELLKSSDSVYFRLYKNPHVDEIIHDAIKKLRTGFGRSGRGHLPILDADEVLGEFRIIKGKADILNLKKACDLTANAHNEVMKYIRPGMSEREIHGYFIYQIYKGGAAREGYNSIVASGPAACTLHYVFNDQPVQAGDLMLLDAAGEYNYFTSDITRCFPVDGKFSKEQGELYDSVLKVQKAILNSVKIGLPFSKMQSMAVEMLVEELLKLKIMTGSAEEIIGSKSYTKYYPHGAGHLLGMDVHDAGLYNLKKDLVGDQHSRQLTEGMVFTVEPGLYVPVDDASPYRGIGIRIEDDVLVTSSGGENLTVKCAKERGEIEDLMRPGV